MLAEDGVKSYDEGKQRVMTILDDLKTEKYEKSMLSKHAMFLRSRALSVLRLIPKFKKIFITKFSLINNWTPDDNTVPKAQVNMIKHKHG
jgi:hypothetical protein